MNNIEVYNVLILLPFVLSTSNGLEELIEKCPSPWSPYNARASPIDCQDKCEGKAFHTNEGKLICFNVMEQSHPKPQLGPKRSVRPSKNINCECVYFIPSVNMKWLPCEAGNNTLETTVDVCEEICERTTVYLYKLGFKRTVVHCEYGERLEFYDMVGQNGKVIRYEDNRFVKNRECNCGIASMELKKTIMPAEKLENSAVSFQECTKPWEVLELYKISILETCEIHCRQVCKRGLGITHKGEAFCFMRYRTAKKRTSFHGGVKGACECGYIKKNNELCTRKFIPCNPPITKNGLSGRNCDEFCAKSTAYIYRKVREPLSIRCIYESEQKPKSLAGKCDERIYQKQRKNVTINYTKCSCGVKRFLDGQIFQKPIKVQNSLEIKLPDSWAVKKKRSIRSHTGCKKNH